LKGEDKFVPSLERRGNLPAGRQGGEVYYNNNTAYFPQTKRASDWIPLSSIYFFVERAYAAFVRNPMLARRAV